MPHTNLMIVQGGGPTAVFNASLAAIVAEAQGSGAFNRIFGARRGTLGLIEDDLADLTTLTPDDLALLRRTPGAALRSSRHKPGEPELDCLVDTLRARNIGCLLFLGGNGTMRGAQLIEQLCHARGLTDLRVLGVPKTVDNDIAGTDRCPGFASAARFYATSVRELGADLRSLRQPVTILETMGRNVGWLAASCALARAADFPAPQVIGLPEVPFHAEAFCDAIDAAIRTDGWAVAVVAEGLRHPPAAPDADPGGAMVWENQSPTQADPLGRPLCGGVGQYLADLVSARLRLRCRNEKPGLLARASIALASAQDVADATLVGQAAVQAAVAGRSGVMVALDPLSPGQAPGYHLVPFAEVAGHERPFPQAWLQPGPIPVAQPFLDYLRPLVGPLDQHLVDLPNAASTPSLEGALNA